MIFGLGPLDLIGILVFVLLIFLLPWLIRLRALSSVNKAAVEVEEMVSECKEIIIRLCDERGKSKVDPKIIKNYLEFFIIPPVDLDPYGLVRKLDSILEMSEDRFQHMIQEVAPEADSEWRTNIIMTLKATLGINSIAKMIRHNLELARKTGSIQILLMIQMNLPLIMRIVKAQFEGVKSFAQGKPIGDGLGPLIAGMLMARNPNPHLEEYDDMIISQYTFKNVNTYIIRAKGPGARIGKVGKTVRSLIREKNIRRIITVDAAVKLEGEKSGIIAEGIGVVIGGPGVDKWMIEELIVQGELQADGIIVKMSPEEAISPLSKELVDAAVQAIEVVEQSISRSAGTNVLVVGVGNSSGLPNIIHDPYSLDIKEDTE